MKGLLLKTIGLWICLITVHSIKAQQSELPLNSDEFHDFLVLQGEVPGLKYRFFLDTEILPNDSILSDSLYLFTKADSGYVSVFFSDFSQSNSLKNNLLEKKINPQIHYFIFSEFASQSAIEEYLSIILKSGDFTVQEEGISPTADIVSLAAHARYSPVEKFKLKFISDLKLFLVTGIIGFFFIVASSMIVFMLITKVRKNKREMLLKKYDEMIVNPLTTLLFEKELQEIIDLDLPTIYEYFPKAMLSKRLFNEVLMDRIIGLNKKMKGEFKAKLKELYKKLELDKISVEALSSQKWHIVAMGLVQINEMDLREAIPRVKFHANSENFQVRTQAVATLLNLSEKVDLKFLRDQTFPLSQWQQMNYLRIIKFVSHQKNLKLEILFDSKNPSIRIFGYKLVRMLGRVDLIEVVAARAQQVPDDEKVEILEIYASFGAHMEVGFVNSCLISDNPVLVVAASQAAGSIGDSETAKILAYLIRSESDFRKKITFSKSLYELDRELFEQIFDTTSVSENEMMKRHILDPMLKNV